MKDTVSFLDIVVIDNEEYLVPYSYKEGELVRSLENKIKLPIEITEGFHINKGGIDIPPASLFDRFLGFFFRNN